MLKTEKFYDLFGSLSFATLTLGSLLSGRGPGGGAGAIAPRQALLSGMVLAWAARLGSFLVLRVMRAGGDSRFDAAKNEPGTFFVYWTLQAAWAWVTLLPVLLVNEAARAHPGLRWTDALGAAIFGAGLLLEAAADWQKFAFKGDPSNAGRFIDTGLWAHSRHPNYFGEMCVWAGVFVAASASLRGAQWAAVASPLFVFTLLRFVSGVPILEKSADARWGASEEYQAYKARSHLLWPFPKLAALLPGKDDL
jgi:steroid 5-alpha reductase family enzyme